MGGLDVSIRLEMEPIVIPRCEFVDVFARILTTENAVLSRFLPTEIGTVMLTEVERLEGLQDLEAGVEYYPGLSAEEAEKVVALHDRRDMRRCHKSAFVRAAGSLVNSFTYGGNRLPGSMYYRPLSGDIEAYTRDDAVA